MDRTYQHIFTPLTIRGITLKNRIEIAPISVFDLDTTPERHPSERDMQFFRMRAMGGAANSRLWTQIKADITGKAIQVPASDAATSLGAALLAGVGVGAYRDFDQAVAATVRVTREHTPNPEHRQAYEQGYRLYRQLYEDLKDTMRKEAL